MKKLFFAIFFSLAFFALTNNVQAQSCTSSPSGCLCNVGPSCYVNRPTRTCQFSHANCSSSPCPIPGEQCVSQNNYVYNGQACSRLGVFLCSINVSDTCLTSTGGSTTTQCYAYRPAPVPFCGDGSCNGTETSSSCPGDCSTGGGGGGGNTCSGTYFSGLSNCGQVGRVGASGSCSAGSICCGGFGGGGPANCSVGFTQNPIRIPEGQSVTAQVNVTGGSGSVVSIEWTRENQPPFCFGGGNFIDTAPITYTANLNAYIGGASNPICNGSSGPRNRIRAYAVQSSGGSCANSADVIVIPAPSDPWWQVTGGDVITGDDLQSKLPSTGSPKFNLDGTGGYPGNVLFGGNNGITGSNISSKGWNAKSIYQGKTYNYSYFSNILPDSVNFNNIGPVAAGSEFNSGAQSSDSYYWYMSDGDLTINSAVTVAGNRKIVLFVNGNLNINGNINITNPGQGFFMTVVSGNININPSVTSLEGIYEVDGILNSGNGSSALAIRGTIVSWGDVNWDRDLGSNNQSTPAENIKFAPDLTMLFPRSLMQDSVSWQELAP